MNFIFKAVLTIALILMPALAYANALQDEVFRIAPNYVGIHETWGPNRGPQVNEILRRAGSTPGNPWCMSLVYTINDNAAKKIKVKNPLPKTAASSLYWKYALQHKLTFKVTTSKQVLLGAKINPGSTGIFKVGAFRNDGSFAGHADIAMRQIDKRTYKGIDGNTTETDKNLKAQYEGGMSAWKNRKLGVPGFLVMGFIDIR